MTNTELHTDLRTAVRELCARFPDSYWRELDAREAYPEEFVRTLTEAGYLAALIPEELGGSGLGIAEASIILEEVNRSGGNSAACHAQLYIMGTLLRHGSEAQRRHYLPKIASGELRFAGLRRDGTDDRHRHDPDEDVGGASGRPLRRERPEGLDLRGSSTRI